MSWPTQYDGGKGVGIGYSGSATLPTVVTSNASPHTKGSWTEITASTPFHTKQIMINLTYLYSAIDDGYLVDIGIGGAGSEVVLISNLQAATNDFNEGSCRTYNFPVSIPAGSRLSARCQNTAGSDDIAVGVVLFSAGYMQSYGGIETIGADESTSRGTQVDPGGVASTKGSWYELIASTSRLAKGIVIASQNSEDYGTFGSGNWWRMDIGIGGAGSEQVIIPDLNWGTNLVFGRVYANQTFVMPIIPIRIPAGSRLSARASSTQTHAGKRITYTTGYLIS